MVSFAMGGAKSWILSLPDRINLQSTPNFHPFELPEEMPHVPVHHRPLESLAVPERESTL